MISKYKSKSIDLKEYKAFNVKTGVSKKGFAYTICNILDTSSKGNNEFYTVFTTQSNLNLQNGDYFVFEDITGVELRKVILNSGKEHREKTIFAHIKPITYNKPREQIQVVEEMPRLEDDNDESLPF